MSKETLIPNLERILRLCVEKTNLRIGYSFQYNSVTMRAYVDKFDQNSKERVAFKDRSGKEIGRIEFTIFHDFSDVIACMEYE